MVKRILIGLVWFVAIYFGTCMMTGAVVGGIAGSNDPQNAAVAGAAARIVGALRNYFLIGAILITGIGTWAGVLPGRA